LIRRQQSFRLRDRDGPDSDPAAGTGVRRVLPRGQPGPVGLLAPFPTPRCTRNRVLQVDPAGCYVIFQACRLAAGGFHRVADRLRHAGRLGGISTIRWSALQYSKDPVPPTDNRACGCLQNPR